MSRKIARDAAMRMLYAYELTGELNQDMIQETIEPAALDAEDMKYLKQVTEGAVEQRASLDTLIEQNAVGWRLSRIGKVDLSILRLAIYEMLCREDVPESVAINEAVELANTANQRVSSLSMGFWEASRDPRKKKRKKRANESLAGDRYQ